ncbi:MAG: hypothetical protein CMF46_02375 [Legionellales bacterium]|nr:hypothetical protein [Legionellales bacterium]
MQVSTKLVLFFLLLLQCSVFADSPALADAKKYIDISQFSQDLSLKYLGQLIGSMPSLANYNISTLSQQPGMMNHLVALYNLGMVMVMLAHVVFYSMQAIMSVTKDNRPFLEVITFWVMLRPLLGFMLILPNTSGYSTIQVIAMIMIAKGVALADNIWLVVLQQADATGTLYHGKSDASARKTFLDSAASTVGDLYQNAACLASYPGSNFYQDSTNPNTFKWGEHCGSITFLPLNTTSDGYDPLTRYYHLDVIASLNAALSNYQNTTVFEQNQSCATAGSSADCQNFRNAFTIASTQLYSAAMNKYTADQAALATPVDGGFVDSYKDTGWASAGIVISELLASPTAGSVPDPSNYFAGSVTSSDNNFVVSNLTFPTSTVIVPAFGTAVPESYEENSASDLTDFLGVTSFDLYNTITVFNNNTLASYIRKSVTIFQQVWVEKVVPKNYRKEEKTDDIFPSSNIFSSFVSGVMSPSSLLRGKKFPGVDIAETNVKQKEKPVKVGCAVYDFTHPHICVDPVSGYMEILFNLSLQIILGIQVYDINITEDNAIKNSMATNMKYNTSCLRELIDLQSETDDSLWAKKFYQSSCFDGYGAYAFFNEGKVENPIGSFRTMGTMLMQAAAIYFDKTAKRTVNIVNNLTAAYLATLSAVNLVGMTVSGMFLFAGSIAYAAGPASQAVPILSAFMSLTNGALWPIAGTFMAITAFIDDLLKTGLQISLLLGNLLVPYGNFIAGVIFSIGTVLGVYVAFLPSVIFLASVISWYVLVFETLLAAPLIAIGITHPEGHDVLGRADQSIMLLVSVVTKPAAILFGLVLALLTSQIAIKLVSMAFVISVGTFMQQFMTIQVLIPDLSNRLVGIIQTGAATTGVMVYLFIVIGVINVCYSAIYSVPDRFMKWVGLPPEQSMASRVAKQLKSQISSTGDKAQSGAVQQRVSASPSINPINAESFKKPKEAKGKGSD